MAEMRHFSPVEQLAILRRHFVDDIPVSQLCEEYGVIYEQYCDWQRLFFERGAAAFQCQGRSREDQGHAVVRNASSEARPFRKCQPSLVGGI